MIRISFFALLCGLAPSVAIPQVVTAQTTCDIAVSQMLNFVETIPQIEASFDKVHSQMTPEDQGKFTAVREKGQALSQAAREYRSAFLAACFED